MNWRYVDFTNIGGDQGIDQSTIIPALDNSDGIALRPCINIADQAFLMEAYFERFDESNMVYGTAVPMTILPVLSSDRYISSPLEYSKYMRVHNKLDSYSNSQSPKQEVWVDRNTVIKILNDFGQDWLYVDDNNTSYEWFDFKHDITIDGAQYKGMCNLYDSTQLNGVLSGYPMIQFLDYPSIDKDFRSLYYRLSKLDTRMIYSSYDTSRWPQQWVHSNPSVNSKTGTGILYSWKKIKHAENEYRTDIAYHSKQSTNDKVAFYPYAFDSTKFSDCYILLTYGSSIRIEYDGGSTQETILPLVNHFGQRASGRPPIISESDFSESYLNPYYVRYAFVRDTVLGGPLKTFLNRYATQPPYNLIVDRDMDWNYPQQVDLTALHYDAGPAYGGLKEVTSVELTVYLTKCHLILFKDLRVDLKQYYQNVSPIPSDYTEISSATFNGPNKRNYLDTDLSWSESYTYEMEATLLDPNVKLQTDPKYYCGAFFSINDVDYNLDWIFDVWFYGTDCDLNGYYSAGTVYSENFQYEDIVGKPMKITYGNKTFNYDIDGYTGTFSFELEPVPTVDPEKKIIFGTWSEIDIDWIALYYDVKSFKVKNANDQLIADMRPVKRNSDNKVGFYDVVRGRFFTATGDDLDEGT